MCRSPSPRRPGRPPRPSPRPLRPQLPRKLPPHGAPAPQRARSGPQPRVRWCAPAGPRILVRPGFRTEGAGLRVCWSRFQGLGAPADQDLMPAAAKERRGSCACWFVLSCTQQQDTLGQGCCAVHGELGRLVRAALRRAVLSRPSWSTRMLRPTKAWIRRPRAWGRRPSRRSRSARCAKRAPTAWTCSAWCRPCRCASHAARAALVCSESHPR